VLFCEGQEEVDKALAIRDQCPKLEHIVWDDPKGMRHYDDPMLARLDDLTGIHNRRALFEIATREVRLAVRSGLPLSIMLFDVDRFKKINDSYGHLMGDQVLQVIAQAVSAEIRCTDMIGRYGGDEFVILLPQTGARAALPFAERIQACVGALSIETVRGPLHLSISLGIAETLPASLQATESLESVFQRADQAMYAAKQIGPGHTVIFGEM
jgi:diguanylate cyclase (GGDEF)-like protein